MTANQPNAVLAAIPEDRRTDVRLAMYAGWKWFTNNSLDRPRSMLLRPDEAGRPDVWEELGYVPGSNIDGFLDYSSVPEYEKNLFHLMALLDTLPEWEAVKHAENAYVARVRINRGDAVFSPVYGRGDSSYTGAIIRVLVTMLDKEGLYVSAV